MSEEKERFTQEYDDTNRGAIFLAKEKRTERSPDRTGELTVQCPSCSVVSKFWLSGWLKKARVSGATFLSLAVNPKTADDNQKGGGTDKYDDGDIPF